MSESYVYPLVLALFNHLKCQKIKKMLNKVLFQFGMSYVNLITMSIYSVAVPPAIMVNLFKGQGSFGSLELAVWVAIAK